MQYASFSVDIPPVASSSHSPTLASPNSSSAESLGVDASLCLARFQTRSDSRVFDRDGPLVGLA